MRYSDNDIQKLIDNVDIVDLIGEYVELKKAGSNYKGVCPFHNEKTPSFVVSPEKGIFNCFGCHASGNVISFYKKFHHIDFGTAVNDLSEKFDVKIKKLKGNIQLNDNKKKSFKLMDDALEFFAKNIFEQSNKKALQYLKKRGFDEKFITSHRLGYALDGWNGILNYLKSKGYSDEEIEEVGLSKKGEKGTYDTFRDRIMFPIFSVNGSVIGFGGRILNNDKNIAKYLNSPETKIFNKRENLYGIINRGEKIRRSGYALLMEGYMDVLTANQFGFSSSVASLGTALTENQAKLLKKYTSNVIICFDMDEAGRRASLRAGYILKRYDFNIRVLTLNGAKDPDEFLRKKGKDEFLKELKNSKEIFDFLYQMFSENLDFDDIISKKKFVENFKDFFDNINTDIEKSLYIEKLSVNTGIEKAVLNQIFIKNTYKIKKNINKKMEKPNKSINKLELETMRIILKNKKNFDFFKCKNIEDILIVKLIEFIDDNYECNNLDTLIINSEFFDEYEKKTLVEIIFSVEDIEDEEEFAEELKKSWELREVKEKEIYIKKKLTKSNISIEEKRRLLYERFETIKKIKN